MHETSDRSGVAQRLAVRSQRVRDMPNLRSGNLGVLDYYKLRNVQADTAMREAVAKPTDGAKA